MLLTLMCRSNAHCRTQQGEGGQQRSLPISTVMGTNAQVTVSCLPLWMKRCSNHSHMCADGVPHTLCCRHLKECCLVPGSPCIGSICFSSPLPPRKGCTTPRKEETAVACPKTPWTYLSYVMAKLVLLQCGH